MEIRKVAVGCGKDRGSVPIQGGEYLPIKGKGEKRREEGYTHLMHQTVGAASPCVA